LWASFNKAPFEKGIAKADLASDEVLALLDFDECFDLLTIPLPTDQKGIVLGLIHVDGMLIGRPRIVSPSPEESAEV
jgi:hypothetical protein